MLAAIALSLAASVAGTGACAATDRYTLDGDAPIPNRGRRSTAGA